MPRNTLTTRGKPKVGEMKTLMESDPLVGEALAFLDALLVLTHLFDQVFAPERDSFDHVMNRRVLADRPGDAMPGVWK